MNIKRFWLSNYKSISDTAFNFKSDFVSLLVGNNGLGKSNLIEALLRLFVDLRKIEKEEDLLSWASEYFQFEINYEINDNEVLISLREHKTKNEKTELTLSFMIRPLKSVDNPFVDLSFKEFQKNKKKLLPDYIVGYYSGENKRIFEIIKEFQESEHKRLLKLANNPKEKVFDESLRNVFFSENIHSPLILLTISLYSSLEKNFPHFKMLLSEYLQIEEIVEFSIRFNNPNWNYEKIGNPSVNKNMDHLLSNIQDNNENPFWNLSGKLDRVLTRFYNFDNERGRDPIYYHSDEKEKKDFEKEILEFSGISISGFANELKDIFVDPINFFDALETLSFIDVLKDLSFKIKKKNISDLLEYKDLSEGEQQLLTSIGLLILFSDKQTLFLYDEPDTHLNPKWQRDYVKLLEDFNQNKINNQMIVATHSPLIVQSAENSDIFLFKKIKSKVEVDSNEHQIHNWRIDQVLTSEYFGFESTRPSNLDDFMKERDELLSKVNLSEEDKIKIKRWEEDFTILPTGETANDIKALRLAYQLLFKK